MAIKKEDLFVMISSTAQSVKILANTDLPQVKEILYEDKPLPEGCPSRASMAELILRGIKGRIEELTELLDDLDKQIWAGWKDKH